MRGLIIAAMVAFFGLAARAHGQPAPGAFISPNAHCNGVHAVVVVAHMDDDLLFIEPTISQILGGGGCVTAVYMTGGDGGNFDRVKQREAASRAGYSTLLKSISRPLSSSSDTNWPVSYITAGNLTIHTTSAIPELTSIYLRIPAGDVRYSTGSGSALREIFELNNPAGAFSYDENDETNLDKQNIFTHPILTATLQDIFIGYGATAVYALNPDTVHYVEHPDHTTSARLVRQALRTYPANIPVQYYETYSTTSAPHNVDPLVAQQKRDIVASFFKTQDNQSAGLCDGADGDCFKESGWNGAWISRQRFKTANAHDVTPNPNILPQPVVNIETQECVTSQGAGRSPVMRPCTSAASQQWGFVPLPPGIGGASGAPNTAVFMSSAGNCLALGPPSPQGAAVLETTGCDLNQPAQYWTPWDYGKIYAPFSTQTGNSGYCLNALTAGLVASACPGGGSDRSQFTASMLWTRNIVNFQSDLTNEAGLVGDLTGNGVTRLVQIAASPRWPGLRRAHVVH